MKLKCIKGYATDENVVYLAGDIAKVVDTEEGMVYLEGIHGWCEGVEFNYIPKIIVNDWEFYSAE
jgi:hypothetical protein